MLLKLKNKTLNLLTKVNRSIAFLPIILILCFIIAATLLMQLESWEIGKWFSNRFEAVIIKNADTARIILSTVIAGLFSLVVFSFSMVMLLLNQASNSFSPRLLPGLISDKQHQFILGIFIGTIVFSLIVLANVFPETRGYKFPGIAVLVSVFLCISSLGLFIYFLHSISKSIQINHILSKLHTTTYRQLEEEIQKDDHQKAGDLPKIVNWHSLESTQTGYIQSVNEKSLLNFAKEFNMNIQVVVPEGTFIVKGVSVIATENKINEEQAEELRSCLQFHNEEVIAMNFNLGFKQITEIILKAMSPGINDPGTAINGIDYLADLFQIRLTLSDQKIISEEGVVEKVLVCRQTFEDLLYGTMSSIRLYIKHDTQVILSSLSIFRAMLKSPDLSDKTKKIIKIELNALITDAMQAVESQRDKDKIQEILLEFD